MFRTLVVISSIVRFLFYGKYLLNIITFKYNI
nr:MAG TPA: hypothetical protein [Ackermannviridae sp.]